jgi:iron complex outermembrane receptor protein
MFQEKALQRMLAAAFGGSIALAGVTALAQQPAQPTPAAPAQKQERIEVTGSAIKRTQVEGPAPVEVYTRKDIERTGATTVAELIKSIAAFEVDDQGELNNNSPTGSGAGNLQIRGLSERNVLVLLNGRRLPINALTDGSGAGAAVDVNSIPISAIERIDVLKDGGSAIYGADAVAGVVNFITRKNYQGLEATLGYGISSRSDGQETPVRVTGGIGDYDRDRFNVLLTLDYFKRDEILRKDRELTRSADFRRFDNGVNGDGRSTFAPQGNIIAGAGAGGTVRPCPPELIDSNGLCRYDFNATLLPIINAADRYNLLGVGSLKLTDNIRAFAEGFYYRTEDTFTSHPAPGFLIANSGASLVRGRFMQAGPRITEREATMTSAAIGLEGSHDKLDWDIAVGQAISKVVNNDRGYLRDCPRDPDDPFSCVPGTDPGTFTGAINAGLLDPTSDTNDPAVVASISITPKREGKSKVQYVNGKGSYQLMDLAGGPLAVAAGLSLGRESLSDIPDAISQAGLVFGSIAQAPVDAKRETKAAFVEVSAPLFKNFESQIALRYDGYDDSDRLSVRKRTYSRTSPKIAAKYRPVANFMIRASYAESFLAPSLKQLFGAQEQGAESTSNPVICNALTPLVPGACNNYAYTEVSGSNPDLKPELGKTYNLGFIVEPTPDFSIGLDIFKIEKRDEINTLSAEAAAERGDVGLTATGQPAVFVFNQNLAQTRVKGADLDIRFTVPNTPIGRLTIRNSTTYYDAVDLRIEESDPYTGFAGTWGLPRYRNTLTVTLTRGPWEARAAHRATGGFADSVVAPFPASTRRVGSYDEFDMGASYTGFKGLTLNANVRNVFDRMPPYSRVSTTNQYGTQGFPWIYSPRGRFFSLSGTYKFF